MTSQNFTLIELCRFLSPHGNDKVILTSAMRRASAFTIAKKSLSQLRLMLPRVAFFSPRLLGLPYGKSARRAKIRGEQPQHAIANIIPWP
jgi:hypothetical protein